MALSKKRVSRSDDSDASDREGPSAPAKKARTEAKASLPGGGSRDANGDAYWEIADRRRVVVSEFKGKTMVSVREFYEKDGQVLPGKKGITMPITQLAALIKMLPALEHVLKEKGERLPRPNYEDLDGTGGPGSSDEKAPSRAHDDGRDRKRNFEETSEED